MAAENPPCLLPRLSQWRMKTTVTLWNSERCWSVWTWRTYGSRRIPAIMSCIGAVSWRRWASRTLTLTASPSGRWASSSQLPRQQSHRNTHWIEISTCGGWAGEGRLVACVARHCDNHFASFQVTDAPGVITASSFYRRGSEGPESVRNLPKLEVMGVSFEPCYTHTSIEPGPGIYKGVAVRFGQPDLRLNLASSSMLEALRFQWIHTGLRTWVSRKGDNLQNVC